MKLNVFLRTGAVGLFLSLNVFATEKVVCQHSMVLGDEPSSLACKTIQAELNAARNELVSVQLQVPGIKLEQFSKSTFDFTLEGPGFSEPVGYVDFNDFGLKPASKPTKDCHTEVKCPGGNTLKCGTLFGICGGKDGMGCFSITVGRAPNGGEYYQPKISHCAQ